MSRPPVSRPPVCRLIALPVGGLPVAVLAAVVFAGCGSSAGGALETLPPIRTTTTSSTTTTTVDARRIYYKVKAGDNLSEIARSYSVPRDAIVDLNELPDGGATLQIGQVLEIPNDVRFDSTLPAPPTESSDAVP